MTDNISYLHLAAVNGEGLVNQKTGAESQCVNIQYCGRTKGNKRQWKTYLVKSRHGTYCYDIVKYRHSDYSPNEFKQCLSC